jgi:tetratricopeptide (TPR) repeat protein
MLTAWLTDNIRNGDAILFLGAGAVRGAKGPHGEKPPNGLELRDLISDKFLGGQNKDKPLARVAEYAKNESSLNHVQSYIRDIFLPIQPPAHYSIIPTFRWFSIVTTNYDLTLERAYAASRGRLQELQPILRDGDQLSAVLRNDKAVPYLKLHGCISAASDPSLPLILATEEYARHRRNRDRLFRNFSDWGHERPIIFAGYDISDPNILQILFDLADLGMNRPTYCVVDPGLDPVAIRYWNAKRFVVVPDTFASFLAGIDGAVPSHSRILAALRSTNPLSFQKWISSHVLPSDRLRAHLEAELTHVHPGLPVSGVLPKEFYSGAPVGWGAIAAGLNFKRRIGDDIILDAVLSPPREKKPRVFLLKGHAGAGISVTLRQVAWESARDFGALVFYLSEGGLVRGDLIAEISELTRARLLLVVDDAIPHLKDIRNLVSRANAENIPIDILLGARTNEWNVLTGDFDSLIDEDYDLRDLTDAEILDLLSKLQAHRSLGELSKYVTIEQVERFKGHSRRQLLVALHEATTGKPFEELVLDEYDHITPARAKVLYLDICTLHRLDVPIRAGLIARVSGVSFAEFSSDLFKPLEHVVFTYQDHASRDYAYRTRHPVIAEFVFQQALPDPIERAAQIRRIIRHMNVDYESDSEAFAKLIKGKTLADLFADKALAKEIFDAAAEAGASPGFINHQRAVFELHHHGGDLRAAMTALESAEAEPGGDTPAVEHTKAMVLRKLALQSEHRIEKERLRAEARKILGRLQRNARTAHAITTLAQLDIDELRELLSRGSEQSPVDELDSRVLTELVRTTEQVIYSGLQLHPSDEYLIMLEAQLSALLNDHPKALRSLQEAFEANPARAFVAVRLARSTESAGNMSGAIAVLERCLAANPGSKECHLELALLHMKVGEHLALDAIGHHLKRSFTEGDSNFIAQFWWARHEYLHGDRQAALDRFVGLKSAKSASRLRRPTGPVLNEEGSIVRYRGTLMAVHPGYSFVRCNDLKADVFVAARAFSETDWAQAHSGAQIVFSVAFSMRGPEGINAQIVSD